MRLRMRSMNLNVHFAHDYRHIYVSRGPRYLPQNAMHSVFPF